MKQQLSPSSSNTTAQKRAFDGPTASPRRATTDSIDLGELGDFLSEDFDVTAFTRQAMQQQGGGESSLKSLKYHLDTVERAISSSVSTHEDALLGSLESVTALKREMTQSRNETASLLNNVCRVETDFIEPLARLRATEQRLSNAHAANAVLRKLGWFLQARRKLKQIPVEDRGGKEAARAAQLLGELEELLLDGSLQGVHLVDQDVKWIKESGTKLRADTQRCLELAVRSKNQGEIALALQAFFYLGVLEERVNATVNVWAVKEFTQEVRDALREGDSTLQLQNLRARMDKMLESTVRGWAVQIWNLQRVLLNKRLPVSGAGSLFDAFWLKACAALEQELKTCNRYVKECLVEDYPSLRKSARAMLGRLWTSTNNVLGGGGRGKQQASSGTATNGSVVVGGPREAQVLMRAFHPLLAEFLARSMARLNQPVHVMFPAVAHAAAAAQAFKPLPTHHDVATFASMLHKELALAMASNNAGGGGAEVDGELLGAIAKPCGMALRLFCERAEAALSKSEAAHQFRGLNPPAFASNASAAPVSTRTPAQEHNIALLALVTLLASKMQDTVTALRARCAPPPAASVLPMGHVEEEDAAVEEMAEFDEETGEESVASPSSSPPTGEEATAGAVFTDALQRIDDALDALRALESEILEDYLGARSEFAFRALDDVLQDVNRSLAAYQTSASVTTKEGEPLARNSFALRFQRACAVFVEEHVDKLPVSSSQAGALLLVLQSRLAQRFAMRICNLESRSKFTREGRALLVREIGLVFTALRSIAPIASKDEGLASALEALILETSTARELVAQGKLSRALAWHFLATSIGGSSAFATQAAAAGGGKTLTQYLNEIEFLDEAQLRTRLAQTCNDVDGSILF